MFQFSIDYHLINNNGFFNIHINFINKNIKISNYQRHIIRYQISLPDLIPLTCIT